MCDFLSGRLAGKGDVTFSQPLSAHGEGVAVTVVGSGLRLGTEGKGDIAAVVGAQYLRAAAGQAFQRRFPKLIESYIDMSVSRETRESK